MSLSDEAKGALWKLRSRTYKPGYLYYPAGKVWLPAQCDLEGRLVIDPTDIDTRYLKLNGSNEMKGDIIPEITNTYSLGSAIKKFLEVHGTYGNIGYWVCDLGPRSGYTVDLGTSTRIWEELYCNKIATDINILSGKAITLDANSAIISLLGLLYLPLSGVDGDNCVKFEPSTRKLFIYNGDELAWNFVTLGA